MDLPFLETLHAAHDPVVLLFEILQHPPSVVAWRKRKGEFAGAVLRLGWAFLDTAHPEVADRIGHAARKRQGVPFQLQAFRCDSSSAA